MSWPRQNPDPPSGQQARARPGAEPARVIPLEGGRPAAAPRVRLVEPEPAAEPDWSATLAVVNRAADQLEAAEARVAELERAYEELAKRASRELALMSHGLEHSELCAKDAGERRREAEEWLRRIHDAIRCNGAG